MTFLSALLYDILSPPLPPPVVHFSITFQYSDCDSADLILI